MEKQTKQYRDKRNISSKTEASVKLSDFSNPLLQSTTGLRSYFLIKSYCCAIYVCSLRRSASQLLTCCCSTSLLLLKFKFSIILCSNFFVNFERLPFLPNWCWLTLCQLFICNECSLVSLKSNSKLQFGSLEWWPGFFYKWYFFVDSKLPSPSFHSIGQTFSVSWMSC